MAIDFRLTAGGSFDRELLTLLSAVALTVVGTNCLNWGIISEYRNPHTTVDAIENNVDVMFSTYVSPEHLARFETRLGIARGFVVPLTPYNKNITAELITGRGSVEVVSAGPRKLLIFANCYENARVRIGQLYFPLWKSVPIAPGDAPILESSPDGLIEVSLTGGQHAFELLFDTGWPERVGLAVTVTSVLAIVSGLLFVVVRKKSSWVDDTL